MFWRYFKSLIILYLLLLNTSGKYFVQKLIVTEHYIIYTYYVIAFKNLHFTISTVYSTVQYSSIVVFQFYIGKYFQNTNHFCSGINAFTAIGEAVICINKCQGLMSLMLLILHLFPKLYFRDITKCLVCIIILFFCEIHTIVLENEITRSNTIIVPRFPFSNMVDPKRVVSYEDMLKVISQPEKVIIDVRNPDEVKSTGQIPSSINIPLNNVQDALATMSEEEFKKQFQRPKPSSSDELIFYCQSGRRSSEALDRALKLGYTKSKTYLGSWNDWSSRQK